MSPTCTRLAVMAASTGSARVRSFASPPITIAIVPVIAPLGPPLTGASSICMPKAFNFLARRLVVSGCEVEVSTTNNPGFACAKMPPGPQTTSSTIAAVGRDKSTISQSAITSPIVSRTEIPSLDMVSRMERETSVPTTAKPLRLRVKAIPLPIFPRPIKPICLNIQKSPTQNDRSTHSGFDRSCIKNIIMLHLNTDR